MLIQYLNSIPRVSCVRMGDVPYVDYKFSRAGGSKRRDDITNLLLQGSTGNETCSIWNFIGFEQVTFPFEGKIKISSPKCHAYFHPQL